MIRAEHIFKSFDGRTVLDDISVEFETGKTNLIIGQSGSGKTVLLKCLVGLHAVDSGEIFYDDIRYTALGFKERKAIRKDIGMIFQEPMTSLNPVIRVGEQVADPLMRHLRLQKNAALAETVELFRLVGIPAPDMRVRDYPHQLSGGMRQRVMIAMAIINHPAILIADEPTTALDVTIQAEVVREIKKLREQYQAAIILVTHNMGVASYISDKIGVMCQGKLVEFGKRDDVIFHPKHEYTRSLLAAVPRLEGKRFAK